MIVQFRAYDYEFSWNKKKDTDQARPGVLGIRYPGPF